MNAIGRFSRIFYCLNNYMHFQGQGKKIKHLSLYDPLLMTQLYYISNHSLSFIHPYPLKKEAHTVPQVPKRITSVHFKLCKLFIKRCLIEVKMFIHPTTSTSFCGVLSTVALYLSLCPLSEIIQSHKLLLPNQLVLF